MFSLGAGVWVIFADLLAIGCSVYFVSLKPNERRMLHAGLGLVLFGVVASLQVNYFQDKGEKELTAQLQTFLSNFCLVTASVGGNLIAAAAVVNAASSSASPNSARSDLGQTRAPLPAEGPPPTAMRTPDSCRAPCAALIAPRFVIPLLFTLAACSALSTRRRERG